MLKNLEILNGVMTPEYDIYNNIYTVMLIDADNLDINYETMNENDVVSIKGNENLKVGENHIEINISNREDVNKIYLIVNKSLSSVGEFNNTYQAVELEQAQKMPEFVGPLIASICFILILLLFYLLFFKKVKKNKTI